MHGPMIAAMIAKRTPHRIDNIITIIYSNDNYFSLLSMQKLVSITSQGQVSIPREMRDLLGVNGPVRAEISLVGDTIVIRPQVDFWSLAGSLPAKRAVSDAELAAARTAFESEWAPKI